MKYSYFFVYKASNEPNNFQFCLILLLTHYLFAATYEKSLRNLWEILLEWTKFYSIKLEFAGLNSILRL